MEKHKLITGLVVTQVSRDELVARLDELSAEGYSILHAQIQNSTMYVLLVKGLF